MIKILKIFGIFLCVCASGTLSSAALLCGDGMQCARPELCESYSNAASGFEFRRFDPSACQYTERCCVLKRNAIVQPERPLYTGTRTRSLCSGSRNYCVPKEKCINGIIRNVISRPPPGPDMECRWNQVCCSIETQPTRPAQPSNPAQPSHPVHPAIKSAPTICGLGYPKGMATTGLARFDEFPWIVKIYEKILTETSFELLSLGVGSLVSPKAVLTVAYKVSNVSETDLIVRGGEWDTRVTTEPAPHVDRYVKNMIIHDDFDYLRSYYDIAILILKEPFELNYHINTICLPQPNTNFVGANCVAAAWGKRQEADKDNSPILKKIQVRVLDRDTCDNKLRKALNHPYFELHSSHTCAGGVSGNTCAGDIGAPLMCPVSGNQYQLAGLLSYNSGCNDREAPGAYVDLTWVRSWILQNIR